MISYNDETVFKITFEAKKAGVWVDIFEAEMYFNYLPRVGDVINIDSCYMEVLAVEYDYKFQFNPTLRVEEIGDFEEYSERLLSKL
ncbi:hypothetical protein ACFJ92_000880 [Vibrio parahaemolyticus]|uniref:hypothetical protein n=1 Tax=Vibrio parahaemolyticus TaxID=670 RepID=UPI00111DBAA5|nr:hypothetical protein [Vibrio parahaemolyticus]EKN4603634.1 hypothetical protein [Vibrio parahaemolyticus]ELR9970992.1 hypothetical protein [Vibrio parahaemolyticus]MBE3737081.1 hypothetical protein [Vibrio parahaemolyticus]TOK49075.1 hypothetical protein CGI18_04945 [Vibrio parahaemolyticus]HCG8149781.1 hypothetical protein [Vibrio parahaemolyticus]